MAKRSHARMVVLAAPAPRAPNRRVRARAGSALGNWSGRAGSVAAMAVCLAVAIGAGVAAGHGSGDPGRDVALVDATQAASATVVRTWSSAGTPGTSGAAAAPAAVAATPAPITAARTSLPAPATGLAAGGIPVVALQAYQGAAAILSASTPACGIGWPLIAAIGRVESNHGRTSGPLLVDGTSNPPVMGILLTGGNGFAGIKDTDGGLLDGNAEYDRAIGPMQFIPSTWKMYASDGNGDGRSDPFNIYDAALAAAKYLCRAGGDLRTGEGLQRAVYSYNHDTSYVNTVLALADEYAIAFNQNRLPIVSVTDTPVPTSTDLPPVNVGGGPETPAATTSPTGSSSPSGNASTGPTPSGSSSPSGSTSIGPTPTGSPSPTGSTSPTDSPSPTGSASPTYSSSPTGSPSPTETSPSETTPDSTAPSDSGRPSESPSAPGSTEPSDSTAPANVTPSPSQH
jgi:membrane-bound lytic murein transglycosylase B